MLTGYGNISNMHLTDQVGNASGQVGNASGQIRQIIMNKKHNNQTVGCTAV